MRFVLQNKYKLMRESTIVMNVLDKMLKDNIISLYENQGYKIRDKYIPYLNNIEVILTNKLDRLVPSTQAHLCLADNRLVLMIRCKNMYNFQGYVIRVLAHELAHLFVQEENKAEELVSVFGDYLQQRYVK